MKVTQNIELWNTPGHTNQDVSAIVRNTPCGTIAVVGKILWLLRFLMMFCSKVRLFVRNLKGLKILKLLKKITVSLWLDV